MKWKIEGQYRKHQNHKNQQNQLLGELWWLLKMLVFLVFLGKCWFYKEKPTFPFSLGESWFLVVVCSKNQLFPRKKLVFAMHCLCFFWNTNFFRKKLFFGVQAFEKPTFPKEKIVLLCKTNSFLGKHTKKNNIFSSHHGSPKNCCCCCFLWFSFVFGQSNREMASEEDLYT